MFLVKVSVPFVLNIEQPYLLVPNHGLLFEGLYYFHYQRRLKSNLPFTAKRDYSQNLKAQLIAVYFNRYMGCKSLFFISEYRIWKTMQFSVQELILQKCS